MFAVEGEIAGPVGATKEGITAGSIGGGITAGSIGGTNTVSLPDGPGPGRSPGPPSPPPPPGNHPCGGPLPLPGNWLGGPPTGPARAPAAASNKAPAVTRTTTFICRLLRTTNGCIPFTNWTPRDHGVSGSFTLALNEAVSRKLRLTTYNLETRRRRANGSLAPKRTCKAAKYAYCRTQMNCTATAGWALRAGARRRRVKEEQECLALTTLFIDERTGKRRLTTYKLKRADAEERFPGAEPGLAYARGSTPTHEHQDSRQHRAMKLSTPER